MRRKKAETRLPHIPTQWPLASNPVMKAME
jgi:hypothetical protein